MHFTTLPSQNGGEDPPVVGADEILPPPSQPRGKHSHLSGSNATQGRGQYFLHPPVLDVLEDVDDVVDEPPVLEVEELTPPSQPKGRHWHLAGSYAVHGNKQSLLHPPVLEVLEEVEDVDDVDDVEEVDEVELLVLPSQPNGKH